MSTTMEEATKRSSGMVKVQLSELKRAAKDVGRAVEQLQTVQQDLQRKIERLEQNTRTSQSLSVAELEKICAECKPPSRATVDTLRDTTNSLMHWQRELFHERVSSSLTERFHHLAEEDVLAAGNEAQPVFAANTKCSRVYERETAQEQAGFVMYSVQERSAVEDAEDTDRPNTFLYAKRANNVFTTIYNIKIVDAGTELGQSRIPSKISGGSETDGVIRSETGDHDGVKTEPGDAIGSETDKVTHLETEDLTRVENDGRGQIETETIDVTGSETDEVTRSETDDVARSGIQDVTRSETGDVSQSKSDESTRSETHVTRSEVDGTSLPEIEDVTRSETDGATRSETRDVTWSETDDVSRSRTDVVTLSEIDNVTLSETEDAFGSKIGDVSQSETDDDVSRSENDITQSGTDDVTRSENDDVTRSETYGATPSETGDVTWSKTNDVSRSRTENVTRSGTDDVSQSETDDITRSETDNITWSEVEDVTRSETDNVTRTETVERGGFETETSDVAGPETKNIMRPETDGVLISDASRRSAPLVHTCLEVSRCKSSVNIDLKEMHVQPDVGEDLQEAVSNTLLAIFKWDEREKYEIQMRELEGKLRQDLKQAREHEEALAKETEILRVQLAQSKEREEVLAREQEGLRQLDQQHVTEMEQQEGKLAALHRHLSEEQARTVKATICRAETAESEAAELARKLEEKEREEKAAAEKVVTLRRELSEQQREGEERLAELEREHQQNVKTFALRLEGRDAQLFHEISVSLNDRDRMTDVLERLVRNYNIRLMGVDCGLHFLMEVPVQDLVSVREQLTEIQNVLEDLVPAEARQGARWEEVPHYTDVNLALRDEYAQSTQDEAETVEETREEASQDMQLEMAAAARIEPRELHAIETWHQEDTKDSFITQIISLKDERLVMADQNNKRVKIYNANTPSRVEAIMLSHKPCGMALLSESESLIAVTTESHGLYLVDVRETPAVKGCSKTVRQYYCVTSGDICDISEGHQVRSSHLIMAGCRRSGSHPASIDILSAHDGVLQKTLVSGMDVLKLKTPEDLCRIGDKLLLVSDVDACTLFLVRLDSGELVNEISFPGLRPRQAAVGPLGNLYLANTGRVSTVLVKSPEQTGKWQRLWKELKRVNGKCVRPRAVCVVNSCIVVSWCDKDGRSSVIKYDLSETFESG